MLRTQIKSSKKMMLACLIMLAMVLMLFPVSALAVDTISIAAGEPVTISWSGTAGSVDRVDSGSSYYPSSFVLYIDGSFTYTATTGLTMTYSYSTQGGDAYVVALPSTSSTLSITLGSTTYTLSMLAPNGAAGGTSPTYVNGYLPLGQYAMGSGWGSLYSNGTNLTGTTYKVTSGYGSTGVSLGAAGGYVQTEFSTPVGNNSTNPYGIDFIVYGNAFNGNPEAASVMVSNDGETWYELAGSRYYDTTTTIRNTSVTYKMIPTSTYAADKKVDISYKIGSASSWTAFRTGVTWWPEYTTEGYGAVSGIFNLLGSSTETVNGVTYQATGDSDGSWTITYSGVTLVKDTDTTNDYQFGYADVHINGSTYGTAANPYAIANTGTGGDGFDISWAVNASGEPVSLSSVKYIRVYTSAAMNSAGTAFTVPGIFGETSAEVCGIYVASGTGSGAATTDLVVKNVNDIKSHSNMGTTTLTTTLSTYNLRIFSDETYVYVNGANVSESCSSTSAYTQTYTFGTGETTKYVQVITQTGTESPYVTMFKIEKT